MNGRPQRELTIAVFVGCALGVGAALLLTRGEGADPARIELAVVAALAIAFVCVGVAYARNHRALQERFRARSPVERHGASILNRVGCGVLLLMIVVFFLLAIVGALAG